MITHISTTDRFRSMFNELQLYCSISPKVMICELQPLSKLYSPYQIDRGCTQGATHILKMQPSCMFSTYGENLHKDIPVDTSVCLSVCPSVCPLTFRVRPVASTIQDGFFPYLVQMINSIRGCVTCHNLWPWPISSRSFGLDLENHARSVASTVLDGFYLYLAQMITIIRECVMCYVFSESLNWDFWQFFGLDLEKNLQF